MAPPVQSGPAPQRLRSVSGSMHLPPQASCVPGQPVVRQVPALQTSPVAHTAPPAHVADAPQCAGSFAGSTQVPPQRARFGAHVTAHVPAEQTWPSPHAAPLAHVVAPQ